MGFSAHFFYSLNVVPIMNSDAAARITEWFTAQPGFEESYELAGLNVRRNGKRSFVEVLLDRRSGQITLDECGRWNRALSQHLEQTDLFEGPYLVEISSPGVDRPLSAARDFARVTGRKIKVRYQDADGTAREFVGRLETSDADGITLRSGEASLTLLYGRILQAAQEINFSKETN